MAIEYGYKHRGFRHNNVSLFTHTDHLKHKNDKRDRKSSGNVTCSSLTSILTLSGALELFQRQHGHNRGYKGVRSSLNDGQPLPNKMYRKLIRNTVIHLTNIIDI